MNRFLLLLVLVFSSLTSNAQCTLQLLNQDACIGETTPSFLQLKAESVPNPSSIEWSVEPATNAEILVIDQEILQVKFNQEGLYTVFMTSDDCQVLQYQFIVHPFTSFQTNILSDYHLCDGNKSVDFEVLNSDSYSSIIWSGTNVGDHDPTNLALPSFSSNFTQPDEFTLSLLATDLNQCTYNQSITVVINDGPSLEELTIGLLTDSEDCVLPGNDYLVDFEAASSFLLLGISPADTLITPSTDPLFNREDINLPLQVSFENDCVIDTTLIRSHSVYYDVDYTTDFDGVLCNGEVITLINNSLHLAPTTADYFSWSGIPIDNILAQSADSISFTYFEDGNYNWMLTYDDGFCQDQYDSTFIVDVDLIEIIYTVDQSIVCANNADIQFSNQSIVDNSTYTYSWLIVNQTSSESIQNFEESPIISLNDIGLWDINLEISSLNCSASKDSIGLINIVGLPFYTSDFDGILCNEEEITLINTSPNLTSSTEEYFSWSGMPLENIVEQSVDSITFTYAEDGNYTWVLSYDDGACSTQYDSIYNVNTDYIEPLLSEGLVQFSCEFNSILTLSDQTTLGTAIEDDYEYSWELSPNAPESDQSISLTSSDVISNISISSTQAQSYNLSLEIKNENTNCSGSIYNEAFFAIGGILVDIISEPLILCDGGFMNTTDFIVSPNVSQYEYIWSIELEGVKQDSSNLYVDSFFFDQEGTYDIILQVNDPLCETEILNSILNVYPSPIIENTLKDTLICDLPLDSTFVIANNSPLFGSDRFEWNLNNSLNILLDTESGTDFNYLFENNDSYKVDLFVINDTSFCSASAQFVVDIESVNNTISSISTETCLPSDIFLSTETNDLLDLYEWNIYSEEQFVFGSNETEVSATLPAGVYDVELITETTNGCVSVLLNEDYIAVNNYTAKIDSLPPNICFDGDDITTYNFTSTITPEILGLPFEVVYSTWNVISYNSAYITQTSIDTFNVVYNFNRPGAYAITYSALINGTSSSCFYNDTLFFNVGVNANVTYNNTICVGEVFGASAVGDLWSESHIYEWSGSTDLLIESPDSSSTAISSETLLGAGVTEYYDLRLKITNDVGCWAFDKNSIEVYEVVADFTISDSILYCSPKEVILNSLNDYYIDAWDWTAYIVDSSSVENSIYNISSNADPSFSLSPIDIYDFSLTISSQHGCSDSLYLDSLMILDSVDPIIQDLDSVICFNGDTLLNKHLQIEFNSVFNTPLNVIEHSWSIEPEVFSSTEDENNYYLTFTESDEYTVTYSFILDSGNGAACAYSVTKTLTIGVNSELTVPELICIGEPFDAEAQVETGIGAASIFEWSTASNLNFSSPNSLQTNITAEGNLSGNQLLSYELGFKVTNDLGCWEEKEAFIDVYKSVADFSATDSGKVCAPISIEFNNLYNNFVSSYEWSYTAEDYSGDSLSEIYLQDSSVLIDFFDQMILYDFTLAILSEHGCSDTITKNSFIDIKRPYPFFTFETDYGCDGVEINVIDSSFYSYDIGLYTQNTLYDSTYYNLNDTTVISYYFPYDLTSELSYEIPLTLNAFLGECPWSYSDTVTIFPNPVIGFSLSDSVGCPPFLVDFVDSTSYILEDAVTYYWSFGDGNESFEKSPTHIFSTPGEFEIYHSVTSTEGCLSDTLLLTKIKIFDYPVASFNYVSDLFCYGEADITFENSSIYITDSIFSLWTINDGSFSTSNTENNFVHFDTTGVYDVHLEITDLHGCEDDTTQFVEVNILDTLVNDILIDFVTVSDAGITVVWEDNPDDYFESVHVYHKANSSIWDPIYDTQNILPNSHFHELAYTSISNEYSISQQDSCGYFSDKSIIHSPVLLNVSSLNYQTVNLNWTEYIGWSEVDYYEIYRSDDYNEFRLIESLPSDSLSYIDTALCNVVYSYYIIAYHSNNEFKSRSNKAFIEPLFVDFTTPMDLSYTTVYNKQFVLTEWSEYYESEMTFYKVDRWDEYFGWQEEFALISESPYLDQTTSVNSLTYLYRVSYADQCGNTGPESRLGSSILLQGDQYSSHFDLSWNAYEDWTEGVENYVVQYYNNNTQSYENIKVLSNTALDFRDSDLSKPGIDTSFCFRVVAISSEDNQIVSTSNERCFITEPNDYFPNAFSPNNDGLNDTFKYEGTFAKSININIYDRQGGLVYSSDEVDFEWDGTFNDTGVPCANGSYVSQYEVVGFDGTKLINNFIIFLIR